MTVFSLGQAEGFTWSFPERYIHGWRLRKKTLSPGTVEYCQLWWVYDKLKNIHKHLTSKAGKEGGKLHGVNCLGLAIFSQRKEVILRKAAYTYKNTEAGKEFFILMVFFAPPCGWHLYKCHSTLFPRKAGCNTFHPNERVSQQKALVPKRHSKRTCRQASSQTSISLCTTDSCPLPVSWGSLH